jgi:hypothetical protein
MVSVLVIRPNVRRFKPGRGDGFLKAIKMRSMTSFGGEVKPSAPRRKILRQVKSHLQSIDKNTSQSQIHNFLRTFLLLATR